MKMKQQIHLKNRLYLASASPRRKQLLGDFGIEAIVAPQNVEEKTVATKPKEIVKSIAFLKAENLKKTNVDGIILAADTIVWYNKVQLGKPKDARDAVKMLIRLSGKTHKVYTGICLMRDAKTVQFAVSSTVKFKKLTNEEIDEYVASGSPMDKAGAYGIQDAKMTKSYHGSYYNIVGLPIERLVKKLKAIDK